MNTINLSINELLERYRQGTLTPEQVCREIKESISSHSDHNIWIHVLNDKELEIYFNNLKDKGPDDLPLYGIPFAIKDNIDLANVPTTAACKEYSYIPEQSAFVVKLLIDAGAIPIGKTNLDQFATGLVGTRSPYGAVKNAFNPDYISGGSSSGSSVAVALGQASFSLGTDTAGSGRVPAAFNNLVGLKPSKGRLSAQGVIPACRSLDCVSLFALNPDDAATIFNIVDKYDAEDSYARDKEDWNTDPVLLKTGLTIGVPANHDLAFFDNAEYEELFKTYIRSLTDQGYEIVEIDFSPFTEAARLLYEGPWIAERYAAIEKMIENDPGSLNEVIRSIISPAKTINAVDTFKSLYQLQDLKRQADNVMSNVDFIITPTAGTHYRIDEIEQEPVQYNSRLGYYTNFMNLLDYAALAIPAGFTQSGLPFGVTLFSNAFSDHDLLTQAGKILSGKLERMGTSDFPWQEKQSNERQCEANTIDVAVCGAHLSGMPLNHQLTNNGAVLLKATRTAACYRFYALAGGPPYRPGLVRDDDKGESIEVEVWRMPVSNFGKFMLGIPSPLGIGKAQLEDGTEVNSFICEAFAIQDAEDITHLKSWRKFIRSKQD